MKRIAIATDSSSGFSEEEAKKLGIELVYIPFIIDGQEYIENSNLTRKDFFDKLVSTSSISTSQPSQEIVKELWDKLLKDYDEVVYVPISSGLSASCKTLQAVANDYNGKVQVVDNKRESVPLKVAILNALLMVQEGKSALEIKEALEEDTYNSSIYIMLPTLKYLKRGGRITAAAAAIGSLLKIKPVLQIQGEKLDAYAKVITLQQAKQKMIQAIKKDLDTRFKQLNEKNEMVIAVAYSCFDKSDALPFEKEIREAFPDIEFSFTDSLPLSIICHIGPDCLGIATCRKYKNSLDLLKK